jgi:hypothetical protein
MAATALNSSSPWRARRRFSAEERHPAGEKLFFIKWLLSSRS